MKNEEKAKQIAKDYPMPPTAITESDVRVMMENSALQMADWKDAQFAEEKKALIDKACKWLKEQESWDYYNDSPCKLMSEERIAEFRRAMIE